MQLALPVGAIAQQKFIRDQLVGAWTLLLDDGVKADGTHVPAFGPNPIGTLIFTADGHYSLAIARSGRAPFASNNRDTATPDEDKATVQGTFFHFGTYTVDDAAGTHHGFVEDRGDRVQLPSARDQRRLSPCTWLMADDG